MAVAVSQHHDALRCSALIHDESVGLAPFGLVCLAGTCFVEFEFIRDVSRKLRHRDVLADVVAGEIGLDDVEKKDMGSGEGSDG